MSRDAPLTVVESDDRLSRTLLIAVSLVLIAGVIAFGLLIVAGFNSSLQPELDKRASLIGETTSGDIERALALSTARRGRKPPRGTSRRLGG